MSILTLNKITEIFCIVDDFCKEFSLELKTLKSVPVTLKGTETAR
jgi:hypothetical protein